MVSRHSVKRGEKRLHVAVGKHSAHRRLPPHTLLNPRQLGLKGKIRREMPVDWCEESAWKVVVSAVQRLIGRIMQELVRARMDGPHLFVKRPFARMNRHFLQEVCASAACLGDKEKIGERMYGQAYPCAHVWGTRKWYWERM